MKIPKTLTIKCICQAEQGVDLTFDVYSPTERGRLHCDFVYCGACQAPISFLLPEGLEKRVEDRYSMMEGHAEPMLLAG